MAVKTRYSEGKRQHSPVDGYGGSAFSNHRQVGGVEGEECPKSDVAEPRSQCATGQRQYNALGEELPDQPSSA